MGNGPLKRKDRSLEMRESKNSFAIRLVIHMGLNSCRIMSGLGWRRKIEQMTTSILNRGETSTQFGDIDPEGWQ